MFIEEGTRWNEMLRTVAGVRTDHYRFKVRSGRIENSGSARAHLASPSLSVAFTPVARTELYFNLGAGFHSNDARGTSAPVERSPGLVKSRGIEAGLRTEPAKGLQTSLAVYRLAFDSKLTYLGDAGATEAGLPSVRHGVELSNYYKPEMAVGRSGPGLCARTFTRRRPGRRLYRGRRRRRVPAWRDGGPARRMVRLGQPALRRPASPP